MNIFSGLLLEYLLWSGNNSWQILAQYAKNMIPFRKNIIWLSEPEILIKHGIIEFEPHIPKVHDDIDYDDDEDLEHNLMMNKTLKGQWSVK